MKIGPIKLKDLVISCLKKSKKFSFIQGTMPFLFSWDNEKIYIYVKTLSSAYFGNQNITRVQLPRKDIFARIRKSRFKFIFLGYDNVNDVFVAWNNEIAKKRLNQSENVSFYSRANIQSQASRENSFVHFSLENGETPICFKRSLLPQFLTKINKIFFDNSKKTEPSKRDSQKNEIEKELLKKVSPMLKGRSVRMLEALQVMMNYYESRGVNKSIKECSNVLLSYLHELQE